MHHAYIFSSIENSCMYLSTSQSVSATKMSRRATQNESIKKKMKEEKRSGKKNNINIWMTCFQG